MQENESSLRRMLRLSLGRNSPCAVVFANYGAAMK
jgi:hypothetical protein